ncbi:MAG: DNA/RNA non-specific endonuclease [Spirochaetales bacterium]|nr:DNA/RNA non-specific endonuclease [Spirochaetales bacterium]
MKKRNGKALLITILIIVVAAVLVAFSPLFLPADSAKAVEKTVEKIVGVDSRINRDYKKLLSFLKGFAKSDKPAETEQKVTETQKTVVEETTKQVSEPQIAETVKVSNPITSNRIEGLEIPRYIKGHEVVRHTGYTLSWNEKYLVADWVAYELTDEELDTKQYSRSEDFRPDENVRKSSQLSDYKNSGYSRGHLAPAQDFKWSENAMSETFYLTNMVPQTQNYNGGIWLRAENATRDAARITGVVYVVTGPVLTDGPFETIGENKVAIPKQCYKALLVIDDEGNVHTIAISIPQNAGKKEALSKYVMTVDALEELTGLDFFYELDDSIESAAEATYDLDYWPKSFR